MAMPSLSNRLAEAAARLLNTEVTDCRPLAGGDLSAVVRLTLADGRDVIVKSSRDGVEAGMLRVMKSAGARVPDVLAADADILVMSVADDRYRLSRRWDDLGEQLKILHAATGDSYGWPVDYAFGNVTICNTRSGDWVEFWKTQRLLCFVPYLPSDFARRIEALAASLRDLIPARPRACLLHGDLWGGNVLAGQDGVTLIDPACYYGDGAVDIAMLQLFDCPENAFYRHYGCRPGSEILAVYSLWPALVHVRLFGRGYLGLADGYLKKLRR
jgi:fructosamine-3-kinase